MLDLSTSCKNYFIFVSEYQSKENFRNHIDEFIHLFHSFAIAKNNIILIGDEQKIIWNK